MIVVDTFGGPHTQAASIKTGYLVVTLRCWAIEAPIRARRKNEYLARTSGGDIHLASAKRKTLRISTTEHWVECAINTG